MRTRADLDDRATGALLRDKGARIDVAPRDEAVNRRQNMVFASVIRSSSSRASAWAYCARARSSCAAAACWRASVSSSDCWGSNCRWNRLRDRSRLVTANLRVGFALTDRGACERRRRLRPASPARVSRDPRSCATRWPRVTASPRRTKTVLETPGHLRHDFNRRVANQVADDRQVSDIWARVTVASWTVSGPPARSGRRSRRPPVRHAARCSARAWRAAGRATGSPGAPPVRRRSNWPAARQPARWMLRKQPAE